MKDIEIKLESPVSDARARQLHDHLAAAGQALRDDEFDTFLFSVADAAGGMTAGCKGEIAFRSAHVSELWIDSRHRGQGVGTRLLQAAEDHARGKGCVRLHLETCNEQARALYERLGYSVFGRLADYEGHNAFYYLEKRLY